MWTTCAFILHNLHIYYLIISYCVALAYSSDEKRAEWGSFWNILSSSISSNKSHYWWCIYRILFESSARKTIHCTKLLITTLKSYILFKILWRLRRCSYAIYTTALFIKGAICNVKRSVCIFHLIMVGHEYLITEHSHYAFTQTFSAEGVQVEIWSIAWKQCTIVWNSQTRLFQLLSNILAYKSHHVYIYSSAKFYQLFLKHLQQFCQWVRGHS